MLHLMRKYATTWMIKIILSAIVVVFVFWGVGSWKEQRAGRVASVNGEPITIEEYKNAYNDILEGLKQSFGNRLTDEVLKAFQINRQAMDRVMNQKLLLQEARRLNFHVTDKELAAGIQNIGVFQKAGIFDDDRYRRVLIASRLTPETFEEIQRSSMLTEKLRTFITGTVKVSEAEALEWFKWQEASVDVDIVKFESDKYENIEPAQEEIKNYFNDNKESYKTEPKIKVRYLHFDPNIHNDQVEIQEEEISAYHNENKNQFITPKTIEARHILFKVEPDAEDKTDESVKKKAMDVLKLARTGKDFAELAKEYSEGPSKDNGGYLGTFPKNAMVEPFASTAFSLKAGEISEPVKTQFGWHLIKVEKVNEASSLPESEAKDKIRQKFKAERTKTIAYDKAVDVYDSLFDGDDLLKAAENRKLTTKTTDFFTRNGSIEGIKNPTTFASSAFDLSLMQISEIQEFEDGYYILQVIEQIPETIPEFIDVKDKVRTDVVKKKREEKAEADANSCLKSLKEGKSITDATGASGAALNATGYFKRNATIPEVGYEPNLTAVAFKLSKNNPLPENVVKGQKGFYVIRFIDRKEPDTEAFKKQKSDLLDRLLQMKKQRAFDEWLSQVKNNSEITVEEGFSDSN
ncbi:MAG TPA: hypothetical protein HPQ03_03575 [Deltaproteobacteria bacterium]|nr:hypothetical protein [Deltaproteobacteria bacterium]